MDVREIAQGDLEGAEIAPNRAGSAWADVQAPVRENVSFD